jgi:hypothetical protein
MPSLIIPQHHELNMAFDLHLPESDFGFYPRNERRPVQRATRASEERMERHEEHERHERRERTRDVAETVVVGALALGFMGAMMK